MTTPASPSAPTPAGDRHHSAAADATTPVLTFEDRLRLYWTQNGQTVMIGVGLVLLGILAKGGWDYLQAQKELATEQEYAAATTPDKLKSFASAHAGHTLAGIARLQLADEAYAVGKSAEAVTGYEEAIAALPAGPLASRAKLGLAMSKLQAGRAADGELALKVLAADATEALATRVEASYQLASLAGIAGRTDEVQKYSDQVMQLDPMSPWTQRVFQLRASLPPSAAPAAASPAVKLPGAAK